MYYVTSAIDLPVPNIQTPIERAIYLCKVEKPAEIHLVLTIDVSSSMDEETVMGTRLDIVKFCILQLVARLDSTTRLTVIVFGDSATVVFDDVVGSYDSPIFEVQCSTNLEDGLRLSSEIITSSQVHTIIQVVMTDGYPTTGCRTVMELRQTIRSRDEQTHILCMFAISSQADYRLCHALAHSNAPFGMVMRCSDSMELMAKEIGTIVGISHNVSTITGTLHLTTGPTLWKTPMLNDTLVRHVFHERGIEAITANNCGIRVLLGSELSTVMITLETISRYTIESLSPQEEIIVPVLERHHTGFIPEETITESQKEKVHILLQSLISYVDGLNVDILMLHPVKEKCRDHLISLQQQLESKNYLQGTTLLRSLSDTSKVCRQYSTEFQEEYYTQTRQ